jgi:8-oxo-dGTP pyrophosphatase MutT (NUDIX family)
MAQTFDCVDLHGVKHTVEADKLEWRPSAYAVVIKAGTLLLTPQLNGYDLPGGGLEFGEMPEQAVVREVKEETGIDVSKPVLIDCGSSFFTFQIDGVQKYYQSILLYYVCDYVGGSLSDAGFTSYEKLNSLFPEWVNISELDQKIAEHGFGSSFDWLPLVKNYLGNE